jgi:hypothetical protein
MSVEHPKKTGHNSGFPGFAQAKTRAGGTVSPLLLRFASFSFIFRQISIDFPVHSVRHKTRVIVASRLRVSR